MTDNLRHWSVLSKTDPAHTKGFQRAGGFKGTAIKPIYTVEKMTEHFGPCGVGWGMSKPEFTTMPVLDEILVYCTVALWYDDAGKRGEVFGVGGDKVLTKQSSGLRSNDEAFKAAYTDALSNAMKQIGMSADVHMGLFDDDKYVREMKREFAEDAAPQPSAAKGAGVTPVAPAGNAPAPAAFPAEFWDRPSLTIAVTPVKDGTASDWSLWVSRMFKAITNCPDAVLLTKLEKENGAAIDGHKMIDKAVNADLRQAFTARTAQLGGGRRAA